MIEQGKLKFGLKWGKYQVVDEMVKVAIFAYEVSSYVNVGNIVIILNVLMLFKWYDNYYEILYCDNCLLICQIMWYTWKMWNTTEYR